MKKQLLLMACCLALATALKAQTVVNGEYFLDTDAGFGLNTPITLTPAQDGTFPFTVNLTNAIPGNHLLYVRTRDNSGNWSHTSWYNISVLPNANPAITTAEYFFDADAGFGQNTVVAVTAGQDVSPVLTASLSSVAPGPHQLYLRTKDNNGLWSHTNVYNISVSRTDNPLVLGTEYFFGTDPGFGNGYWAPFAVPAADGAFPVVLPPAQATPGPVTMYTRTLGNDSAWSHTTWKDFTIFIDNGPPPPPPPPNGLPSVLSDASMRLYPNPSNGPVRLVFSNDLRETVLLSIRNAAGALVKQQRITQKETVLDLDLPSGLYQLSFQCGSETAIRRMLISK